MMAADSLRFIVRPIVLSGVFSRCSSPCRCACRASASAPHVAQHPATLSHVQASCLEHAWPTAIGVFPGALAASSLAARGRRCRERKREAEAEGKIKGRGTDARENPVCTWGWRGTRQRSPRAAKVRNAAQALTKSCASRAGLRWRWMESLS
ncbi:MAG: hypothetical protein LBF16_07785 [Pseudomonadales bacterium]|nr:hypothetical protein [Pseudomonadales bacterium]